MDLDDKQNKPIGIFDSGIGGLTVLHSIIEVLPCLDTIYVGDTARVPYGTKSARIVTQYSLEIADFLVGKSVRALVIACNTASAFAFETLESALNIPVIGMINPAAEKAVKTTKSGRIGIIGTEGTIRSDSYTKAIKDLLPGAEVFGKACPLFVPLAEEGWTDTRIAEMTAAEYLDKFKGLGIDTVILGCTHYPLLTATIKKVMGEGINLIDSGKEASLQLKLLLKNDGQMEENPKPSHLYFVTDTPDRFLRIGEKFLGDKIGDVQHIDIP